MACFIAIPSVFVHVPDRRHLDCPFPFGNLYSPVAYRSHSLAEHADGAHSALPTLQGPGTLTLSSMSVVTESSHALKMYVKIDVPGLPSLRALVRVRHMIPLVFSELPSLAPVISCLVLPQTLQMTLLQPTTARWPSPSLH